MTGVEGLALFDMDGTLVRKNTASLYIRYEYEQGRVPWSRVMQVAWWRARYMTGYINADELAERALHWYRGRALDSIESEMPDWFARYVRPHITVAAQQCVTGHRQRGDTLAIVTGAAPYATRCVAEHFGIGQTVCSEVEIQGGMLTGKLIRPACVGAGKLERTQRWLTDTYPNLSLAQATFYTDSVTDLPLLEAVGNPVVVNPDPRLRRIALKRKWPVLLW